MSKVGLAHGGGLRFEYLQTVRVVGFNGLCMVVVDFASDLGGKGFAEHSLLVWLESVDEIGVSEFGALEFVSLPQKRNVGVYRSQHQMRIASSR